MMGRALTIRGVLVATVLALSGWTTPAQAQEGGQPLSKSELIRLVVTDAYSGSEKAALIRNSCLSFAPTVGDWADIEALGAPDEVQSAIRGCTRPSCGGPPC